MLAHIKIFASHINIPKENWNMYHEPFKDTCLETKIVTNDCNKHAPLLKILFLISMLIFVEHLDLVKRIKSKRIIVFIIGKKKLQHGTEL